MKPDTLPGVTDAPGTLAMNPRGALDRGSWDDLVYHHRPHRRARTSAKQESAGQLSLFDAPVRQGTLSLDGEDEPKMNEE